MNEEVTNAKMNIVQHLPAVAQIWIFSVLNSHSRSAMVIALKLLSDNSDSSWCQYLCMVFFSFILWVSWLLIWQVIFYCILFILDIILGGSKSYLFFLFLAVTLCLGVAWGLASCWDAEHQHPPAPSGKRTLTYNASLQMYRVEVQPPLNSVYFFPWKMEHQSSYCLIVFKWE